jgi:hypothetical protein
MHRLKLLIVPSMAALSLLAQTDRVTRTRVALDPSRSVVAGAKLNVHSVTTGIDYPALANSAGVYTLTGCPVGLYTASILATGFDTLHIQALALEVGETRTLNPVMRVGTVSSNVTVIDATPDLNLTMPKSAESSTVAKRRSSP